MLSQEPLPKEDNSRKDFYELYAVVYLIEQQNTGRHLVSCAKVSKPFHKRKEGVSCEQWYLFNDFCLQPIEKVTITLYLYIFISVFLLWGAPVAQSIEPWTCDWKVVGSNSNLEGSCGILSIFSAPCA